MPRIEILDPTKSGRPAEHLENKLRQFVVGQDEAIRQIVRAYQTRLAAAAANKPFLVDVTQTAREFLLEEGTDFRYGARHLKRAIERLLVQPLSNLIASGQIHRGDCIRVSHEDGSAALMFGREPEVMQAWGVARRAA